MKNAVVATSKQVKYNQDHKHLRARIGSIFGEIKSRFDCLRHPFRERAEQLDLGFFVCSWCS